MTRKLLSATVQNGSQEEGKTMVFALIAVGALLIYLAYRFSQPVPVYTVCGCGDDGHDDPSCSRYGTKDQ